MPMRGKLKQNDEAVIRQNYLFLKEEIEAKHIVDYLYSKDVISLDDKEEIVCQPSRSRRNDVLLDKLMHAGPGIAYCEFLKALDEEYSHVSQKLRKTKLPAAQQQQEQSWFEELPDQFKQTLITDAMATRLSECFGSNWESVMLELGHTQVIIDREKQNCSNNVVRAITNLLIKWRQKQPKVATYEKLVECLESMKDGGNVNIDFNELEKIIVAENTRLSYAMETDESILETIPRQESNAQ
ncbi:death domain-containing protein CRADD-like [Biomphalaria glabrata]|uniref:Death domain-containing protein CRADD-like n=1 Tax=Biomphalaria glabrata TaxID=6526 RepID=A0A9U8DWP0_BIOGL|nr:death domain-containing protein CRADD-like [Biomphalaria glabrata]